MNSQAQTQTPSSPEGQRSENVVKQKLCHIYGPELGQEKWFALPNPLFGLLGEMLAKKELTYQEAYTLLVLLRLQYHNGGDPPRIGYKRLGHYLGINERRIRDVVCALESKGLLERDHRRLGLKNMANRYRLDGLFAQLRERYPAWRDQEDGRRRRARRQESS